MIAEVNIQSNRVDRTANGAFMRTVGWSGSKPKARLGNISPAAIWQAKSYTELKSPQLRPLSFQTKRAMSLMAHSVVRGMSAIWSLSEAKRTLFGTGASWLGREW